jgi:hypothetical protein
MKDLCWPNERYVRIYVRDTPEWLGLSFDAQALYVLIHRKADRAGTIVLGRQGTKGVAVILHRVEKWQLVLEPALIELIAEGFVTINDGILIIPDFVAAQEAVSSGKARQQKYREGRKAAGEAARNAMSLERDEASPGDETSKEGDDGVQHGTEGEAQYGRDGTVAAGDAYEHGDTPYQREGATSRRPPFWDDEEWSFDMREPLSGLEAGLFDKRVESEAMRIRALHEHERAAAEADARRRIETRFSPRAGGGPS